jgi:hypothetical protein
MLPAFYLSGSRAKLTALNGLITTSRCTAPSRSSRGGVMSSCTFTMKTHRAFGNRQSLCLIANSECKTAAAECPAVNGHCSGVTPALPRQRPGFGKAATWG